MQLEEYKSKFADDSSPGWDALNVPLQDVYDEQEPKHWGTILSHMFGGPDPLDGVSAYSCEGEIDHLHFVTFGYSSLYYENIARYVFESGKHFAQYHFIPANGPIHADSETEIVGLAFDYDTVLPNHVQTPHGQVEFIQGFGLVQNEIDSLMDKSKTVKEILDEHRQLNPLLVTDLTRKNDE